MKYSYLEISAEELKPGMIPAAASVALMLPSGMADLPSRLSEDLSCRLTEKQIAAIRKWFSKQKDIKEITIVRKIPFAIFITLGYQSAYFRINKRLQSKLCLLPGTGS